MSVQTQDIPYFAREGSPAWNALKELDVGDIIAFKDREGELVRIINNIPEVVDISFLATSSLMDTDYGYRFFMECIGKEYIGEFLEWAGPDILLVIADRPTLFCTRKSSCKECSVRIKCQVMNLWEDL